MTWCPHCIYFALGQNDPTTKKLIKPAQWPIMLADKELNSRVELVHHEWNHRDKDGAGRPMKIIPRPPGYDFINAGPMFVLEAGKDTSGNSVGVIFGGGPRDAPDLKKWIFDQMATNPLFKQKAPLVKGIPVVTQQPSRPTPAAASAVATSRPNNMVGNRPTAAPVAAPIPPASKQQSGADKLRVALATQHQQPAKTPATVPVVSNRKIVDNAQSAPTKTNFTYKQAGTTTRLVANLN